MVIKGAFALFEHKFFLIQKGKKAFDVGSAGHRQMDKVKTASLAKCLTAQKIIPRLARFLKTLIFLSAFLAVLAAILTVLLSCEKITCQKQRSARNVILPTDIRPEHQ